MWKHLPAWPETLRRDANLFRRGAAFFAKPRTLFAAARHSSPNREHSSPRRGGLRQVAVLFRRGPKLFADARTSLANSAIFPPRTMSSVSEADSRKHCADPFTNRSFLAYPQTVSSDAGAVAKRFGPRGRLHDTRRRDAWIIITCQECRRGRSD